MSRHWWTVLAAFLALAAGARSAAAWTYVIDEERTAQQANFCREEQDVRRILRVFAEQGARPGYEALTQAESCATLIQSFTPREVVAEVTIARGEENEYKVRFLRVTTREGEMQYLFTTRAVTP